MENNILREARLIVPPYDSAGKFRPEVVRDVRRRLINAFGGYTETMGRGACTMADGQIESENVRIFDVAISRAASNTKLRGLAKYVAEALNQESVYLRTPENVVEFVPGPRRP